MEELPVPGDVLPLFAASPAFPFGMLPGGRALPSALPAFISVEGGVPPLFTGAPLDWARADKEPRDKRPATVKAVNVDLFMMHLLLRVLT